MDDMKKNERYRLDDFDLQDVADSILLENECLEAEGLCSSDKSLLALRELILRLLEHNKEMRKIYYEYIATPKEELKRARVLEIEEVYDCNEGDCLWLEVNGEFCGNALYISSEKDSYVDMRSATHRFSIDPTLYLQYWRLWTKEPTIDQRMNTPWEGK